MKLVHATLVAAIIGLAQSSHVESRQVQLQGCQLEWCDGGYCDRSEPRSVQCASVPVGPPGRRGDRGYKGVPGVPGPPGPPGGVGPDGVHGRPGHSGGHGGNGANGSDGSNGRNGDKGVVGHTGSQGQQGADGSTGSVGKVGSAGPRGVRGRAGRKGASGHNGENGKNGVHGPQGAAGAPGLQGEPGSNGKKGEAGRPGIAGLAGRSGNNGMPGIPGEKGRQGMRGPMGPDGARGENGDDGDDGSAGVDGRPGSVGEPGAPGPNGQAGPAGDDMENIDMVALEALVADLLYQAIDELSPPKCRVVTDHETVCKCCKPPKKPESLDLVFLVDGSDSIRTAEWSILKTWLKNTIGGLADGSGAFSRYVNSATVVVQYSGKQQQQIHVHSRRDNIDIVSDFKDLQASLVAKQINTMLQFEEGTYTNAAFEFVLNKVCPTLPAMNQFNKRALITVTNGRSKDTRALLKNKSGQDQLKATAAKGRAAFDIEVLLAANTENIGEDEFHSHFNHYAKPHDNIHRLSSYRALLEGDWSRKIERMLTSGDSINDYRTDDDY